MCEYREDNHCKKTGGICPWLQWCGKINAYKERPGMNEYCKFLKEDNEKIPEGYFKVEFERQGYLYITFKNDIIKVKNPFDYIPKFVKVKKNKLVYKLSE